MMTSLTLAAEAKLRTLPSLLLGNPEPGIEISGQCTLWEASRAGLISVFKRARACTRFLTASGWKPDITAKLNGAGSGRAVACNPEMQHLSYRVEILIISAAD